GIAPEQAAPVRGDKGRRAKRGAGGGAVGESALVLIPNQGGDLASGEVELADGLVLEVADEDVFLIGIEGEAVGFGKARGGADTVGIAQAAVAGDGRDRTQVEINEADGVIAGVGNVELGA